MNTSTTLDSKIPGGPLADKWDRHKFESKLVNPANRRKYTVIIVVDETLLRLVCPAHALSW